MVAACSAIPITDLLDRASQRSDQLHSLSTTLTQDLVSTRAPPNTRVKPALGSLGRCWVTPVSMKYNMRQCTNRPPCPLSSQDSHLPLTVRLTLPRPSVCHTASLQTPNDKEQALQVPVSTVDSCNVSDCHVSLTGELIKSLWYQPRLERSLKGYLSFSTLLKMSQKRDRSWTCISSKLKW